MYLEFLYSSSFKTILNFSIRSPLILKITRFLISLKNDTSTFMNIKLLTLFSCRCQLPRQLAQLPRFGKVEIPDGLFEHEQHSHGALLVEYVDAGGISLQDSSRHFSQFCN